MVKIKLYTSYFAKLKSLPRNVVPIAICAKVPDWFIGPQYKKLAPKYGFFMKWKQDHDNDAYISSFQAEVLNHLNFVEVINELRNLAGEDAEGVDKDIALICYEKPTDFCHRHLVAEWMNLYKMSVEEWK